MLIPLSLSVYDSLESSLGERELQSISSVYHALYPVGHCACHSERELTGLPPIGLYSSTPSPSVGEGCTTVRDALRMSGWLVAGERLCGLSLQKE